jgi:FlaG/FlaF family flagellin (archaellin)
MNKRNKKGLSEVIGYILLISISIVMSVLVYQYLKTYVPKEAPTCDEGTSIFIKEIVYDCTNSKQLNITFKNNGRFSISGYYIHVSDNPDKEQLAVIDLSTKFVSGGSVSGSSIIFSQFEENGFVPESENVSSFDISEFGTLYRLEIIPIRIQEIDDKKKLVSCSNAKVEEDLVCA